MRRISILLIMLAFFVSGCLSNALVSPVLTESAPIANRKITYAKLLIVPTATPLPDYDVVTADTALNVRYQAGIANSIKATLFKGDVVLVLSQCDDAGWRMIEYNGMTGYVNSDYLAHECE